MNILCDFSRFYDNPKRGRESARLALTARALTLAGHQVRCRIPEDGRWWSSLVPRATFTAPPDVTVCTDHTAGDYDHGEPVALLQTSQNAGRILRHQHVSQVVSMARSATLARGFRTAKVWSVPWAPDYRLHETIFHAGLVDEYLGDDLRRLRRRFPRDVERRAGGWFGSADLYLRGEKAQQLPNWVDFRFSQSPSPIQEWVSWTTSCLFGIDLPGVTWKTSRFSALVLLGVPVVCCTSDARGQEEPYEALTTPVGQGNVVDLPYWGDHNYLHQHANAASAEEVVRKADLSWAEGWSVRAQILNAVNAISDE